MDELEISGRRYLSAKRAARNHRYHSDYIGQLIRSNKVVGQKVGRAWYVDAESLDAYFKGEPQPVVASEPAVAVAPPVAAAPAVAPAPVQKIDPTVAPDLPRAVPIVREQQVPITKTENAVTFARPISLQSVERSAPQETGLRFVPDDEPLSPMHTMQDFVPAYNGDADEESPNVREAAPAAVHRRRSGMPVALTLLGVFAFSFALGASYLVASQTTVIGERASASFLLSLPQ